MKSDEQVLSELTGRFDQAWQTNHRPSIKDFLNEVQEGMRARLLKYLLPLDATYRRKAGEAVSSDDYRDLCRLHGIDPVDALRNCLMAPENAEELASTFVPDAADQQESNLIGNFRLIQRLGEGGMGTVWMAEQSEPVKRRVALKVIRQGIGSKEVIARFEAERQALALMNHPNIARILDAGTTPDGQPFFAMELVQGKPFTTYCDENRLGINERLELFADVCSGVQHAHQKGIIHRDLKPSNILVTVADGKPVPKIIDFGLAKAMESTQRLTDQSLFTGIGQILGTFKYMSPEQASLDSIDIDTRTDIYAMGVVLYELLTGSTPLDDSSIRGQAALKVLEFIREKEPVRPSSKLGSSTDEQVSTITGQRKTDSVRLNRILQGDLDWIVMKALEKDRTRRYESASGFAADIRRYLCNEPIIARPPSLSYRIRKFVRKNRLGVTAASLVIFALLGGIAGTTGMMLRARIAEQLAQDRLDEAIEAKRKEMEQRERAEAESAAKELALAAKERALAEETRQRQYAEAVAEFVEDDFLALTSVEGQTDLFEDASARELSRDTTLRELLDRAAEKLTKRKNLAPEIEARLCGIIGDSYRANGDFATALPFLQQAVNLRRDHLGSEHPDTLLSMNSLARGYGAIGQFENALALYEQTLELRKSQLGPDHHETLRSMHNLGLCCREMGLLDAALPLIQQTLDMMTSRLGPDHPDTLICMNTLAVVYIDSGQLDKALPLYQQTLELQTSRLGPDHPDTLNSMNNLAMGYLRAGQPNLAISQLEQTLEMRKSKLGHNHPDTLISMHNLAAGYDDAGQPDRALPLYEQTLEMRTSRLGSDHPDTLDSMNGLALAYLAASQLDKALPLLEKTLTQRQASLGPDHPNTVSSMCNLALGYADAGQLDRALPLYEQSLEFQKSRLGTDHPNTLVLMNNLAVAYLDHEQLDKALALLEQTLELQKSILGLDHPDTLSSMSNLATCYRSDGQLDKALPLYEQTLELRKSKLGPDHVDTLKTMNNLAVAYLDHEQWDKALPLLEQTLELQKSMLGSDHPDTLNSLNNLAVGYKNAGQWNMALPVYEQLLHILKTKHGPDHVDTLKTMNNLAVGYSDAGQADKAVPLYEQIMKLRTLTLGPDHPDTLTSMSNLAWGYRTADQLDQALPLYEAVAMEIEKGNFSHQRAGTIISNTISAYTKAHQFADADRWQRKWLVFLKTESGAESSAYANALASFGLSLMNRKSWEEAEGVLRECLTIREKNDPDHWTTFNTRSMLGACLLDPQRYDEAEPLLRAGYEGMKEREATIPPQGSTRISEALDRLIELCTVRDNPADAAKYQELRSQYPAADSQ